MRLKVSRSKNAASLYVTKPYTKTKSNEPLLLKNLNGKRVAGKTQR